VIRAITMAVRQASDHSATCLLFILHAPYTVSYSMRLSAVIDPPGVGFPASAAGKSAGIELN
jgi:hypothetical protein